MEYGMHQEIGNFHLAGAIPPEIADALFALHSTIAFEFYFILAHPAGELIEVGAFFPGGGFILGALGEDIVQGFFIEFVRGINILKT